ncbi:molybdenum cofactor guanylyltransferase [Halopseudomonas litoralis]|uniref:Molybdenum cofactor guanylyltransferase n=1 Tax=Halopseudomonas litoralis TaxID=797277 RepID=A0A1H1W8C8_9GAMM|nr:molybdenum cofactor guanylyltransferase [Halopseudomonas litoralis]
MSDMHPPTPLAHCSILLLAGGRGQRMGGQDKGWVRWGEHALIEHVQRVARPLTDDLIISCNRNQTRYRALADQLVSDPADDFPGPLIGIIEALKIARHPNLLVLPCDAPRIDRQLLEHLCQHAGERPVMLRQDGYWQPLFSLLPTALLPRLQQQWQAGQRSVQRALRELDPVALDYPGDDPRLSNFNEPALLADAPVQD